MSAPQHVIEKMNDLRKQIKKHIVFYYEQDAPKVSDADYDSWWKELKELESDFPEFKSDQSPTAKVGGRPSRAFERVDHSERMLSLEKAYSDDDLRRFLKRLLDKAGQSTQLPILAMPKLDGLAVSLRYEAGRFKTGATRGNGQVGEDVTANLRYVGGVPVEIGSGVPGDFEVRGEVVMSRDTFDRLNYEHAEKEKAKEKTKEEAKKARFAKLEAKAVEAEQEATAAAQEVRFAKLETKAAAAEQEVTALVKEARAAAQEAAAAAQEARVAQSQAVAAAQEAKAAVREAAVAAKKANANAEQKAAAAEQEARGAEQEAAGAAKKAAGAAKRAAKAEQEAAAAEQEAAAAKAAQEAAGAAKKAKSVAKRAKTAAQKAKAAAQKAAAAEQESAEAAKKAKDAAGRDRFATPRNAAAGCLRQIDAEKTRGCGLEFHAFSTVKTDTSWPESAEAGLARLGELRFNPVQPAEICHELKDMMEYVAVLEKQPVADTYVVDGAVFCADDARLRTEMGVNAIEPRYAVAFKFAPQSARTRLLYVRYQVGRSGVVTPVAKLERVMLGDVSVKSVTLHNISFMAKLDLHCDDTVTVVRAGDVIPKIESVIAGPRLSGSRIEPPADCPVCKCRLERRSVNLVCPNAKCPRTLLYRLLHFVSRGALDIRGFGPKILEMLIKRKKRPVTRPAKVIALRDRKEELEELDRIGKKSANNLIAAIDKARNTTLRKVLNGLGIPGLGATGAAELAKRFGSPEKIAAALPETIAFVGPITLSVAREVADELQGEAGRELRRLREVGVSWPESDPQPWRRTSKHLLDHLLYLERNLLLSDGKRGSEGHMADLFAERERNELYADLTRINGGKPPPAIFSSATGHILLDQLHDLLGVFWVDAKPQAGPLAGKKVLVTGAIEGHTRSSAKELVALLGGTAVGQVSAATDCIIVGNKPGRLKLAKAEQLDIKTITGENFLALGNGGGEL